VRQLEAHTQRNKKDTEIINVKMKLINLIQSEYFKSLDTMEKSPATVNLVFNYNPHQTENILKRKLKKDNIKITPEILKNIDVLDKIMLDKSDWGLTMKKRLWLIALFGVIFASLSFTYGCAGSSINSSLPCERNYTEDGNGFTGKKASTSVKFENQDRDKVVKAAVSAVIEEGYIVSAIDKEAGIISGYFSGLYARQVPIVVQVDSQQTYVTVTIKITLIAGGTVPHELDDSMCAIVKSIEQQLNAKAL
jgi:hypothetical protein